MPDSASADALEEEIRVWTEKLDINLDFLAVPECGRGKLLFPGSESRRARALDDLLNKKYDLVIGSINSLLGPAQSPAEIKEAALILEPDMEIPPQELLEKLVALDYDDEYEVTVSGEFAKRGGIIDLFSPAHDAPCRVEFFGDTVETLRLFDPATQRSTGPVREYRIIGRSGITAGGEADSDVFAYFDFRVACVACHNKVFRCSRAANVSRVSIKLNCTKGKVFWQLNVTGIRIYGNGGVFIRR